MIHNEIGEWSIALMQSFAAIEPLLQFADFELHNRTRPPSSEWDDWRNGRDMVASPSLLLGRRKARHAGNEAWRPVPHERSVNYQGNRSRPSRGVVGEGQSGPYLSGERQCDPTLSPC